MEDSLKVIKHLFIKENPLLLFSFGMEGHNKMLQFQAIQN